VPGMVNTIRAWGLNPKIRDAPIDALEGSLSENPEGD